VVYLIASANNEQIPVQFATIDFENVVVNKLNTTTTVGLPAKQEILLYWLLEIIS